MWYVRQWAIFYWSFPWGALAFFLLVKGPVALHSVCSYCSNNSAALSTRNYTVYFSPALRCFPLLHPLSIFPLHTPSLPFPLPDLISSSRPASGQASKQAARQASVSHTPSFRSCFPPSLGLAASSSSCGNWTWPGWVPRGAVIFLIFNLARLQCSGGGRNGCLLRRRTGYMRSAAL